MLDEKTDTVTHDHNLVMKNLKSFHTTLHTRKSRKTERQCFEYLAEINTPVLTPEERELCEGQLTLNEIFNALNIMHPGNDGLIEKFYLAFFDLLGFRLLKCFNYAFSNGELSASQRQAVVTLIEKKGRDKKDLLKTGDQFHYLMLMQKLFPSVLQMVSKKLFHL